MRRWLMQTTFAVVLVAVAGGAFAQCAGFVDVSTGSGFCQNVEWLKNRAITLGCQSPPNPPNSYCPNDNVTRLSMAAFMNRLGRALTPEVLHRQATFGVESIPGLAPAPPLVRCVTPGTAAALYPRQVVVTGSLTGLADGNAAGFNVFLFVSTDGGASYSNLDAVNSIGQRATAAPNSWAGAAMTEQLDLAPNTTYQFAIGVRRDGVGPMTTGNFAAGRCQVTASIFNRNGTSSPFDPQ